MSDPISMIHVSSPDLPQYQLHLLGQVHVGTECSPGTGTTVVCTVTRVSRVSRVVGVAAVTASTVIILQLITQVIGGDWS